MPRVDVVFYRDAEGDVPVLDWLRKLRRSYRQAYAKCIAALERLAEIGHELRRPLADFLRDGIHELRVRRGRVNYRILYFFHHGRDLAVLAHALTKEGEVPNTDIDRAVRRGKAFASSPAVHTYAEEERS
jgi:phage-related protein